MANNTVGILPYLHTQTIPSSAWVISHGLGHPVACDVFVSYNGSLQKILPSSVIMSADMNSTTITFSTPFTGTAKLI